MSSRRLLDYYLADLLFILIATFIICVVAFVVFCISVRCKEVKEFVSSVMTKYFSHVWSKSNSDAKTVGLVLSDYENNLKKNSVFLVFLLAFTCSICYVVALLWDAFLLKIQQDNCVEGLDCYMFNGDRNVLCQRPLNCSSLATDYPMSDDFTIFCYKYVFDFSRVLNDAGGALVSIGIEFLVIAAVSRFLSEKVCFSKSEEKENKGQKKEESKEGKESKEVKDNEPGVIMLCCYSNCVFFLAIFVLCFIIVIPQVIIRPAWDVYFFSDVTKPFQHVAIGLHIFFAFCIPWQCKDYCCCR